MKTILKYLIIISLTYYLIKSLLYLLFWRATEIIEEKGREKKARRMAYYKRKREGRKDTEE